MLCVGLWQSVDENSTAAAAAAAAADGDGGGVGGGVDGGGGGVGGGVGGGGEEEEGSEMSVAVAGERDVSVKRERAELPVPESLTSPSGLPLRAVKSSSSEWTDEDMQLDWTQQVTVHRLQLLRDFLIEGMQVSVVEEKVCILLTVSFNSLCFTKHCLKKATK